MFLAFNFIKYDIKTQKILSLISVTLLRFFWFNPSGTDVVLSRHLDVIFSSNDNYVEKKDLSFLVSF